MLLDGTVAIVTGGSSGIGRAIALALAEEGSSVAIGDVNNEPKPNRHWESDPTPTRERIRNRGGEALFVETDVSDPDACERLVTETVDSFGQLDILVNNAGIHSREYPETAESLSIEEWHRVMDVNLSGQFYCSKYALPELKDTGGTILNLSSVQGHFSASCPAYSASKAATLNFTRDLAASYGVDDVTVNAICPGPVKTPNSNYMSEEAVKELVERTRQGDGQTALPRLGEPEDIGHLAAFLASEKADWITGEYFTIDGGYTTQLE